MNTTYFLNLVAANLYCGQNSPAIPNAYYVGLSTTEPMLDGSNVSEPSLSNGYSRVLLADLSDPASGVVTNASIVRFPESTGSWGKITHYVVYDGATGGNLLMYGTLPSARTIETETEVIIKAGYLKLSAQNPA